MNDQNNEQVYEVCTKEETKNVIRDALNDFRATSEIRRKPRDYAGYATSVGVVGAVPLIWSLSGSIDEVNADVRDNYANLQYMIREATTSRNELDRDFQRFQTNCDAREHKYADVLERVQSEQNKFRQELVDVKSLIRDAAQTTNLYQQRMTQLVGDFREITGKIKEIESAKKGQ